MTVAKDVVQFLMDIFGDRQAAHDFLHDPEGVLEHRGLGSVCSADVDAAMPVVLDYAPLTVNASNVVREFNAAGNSASIGGGWSPLHAGSVHDDHGHAVEQLAHIVANYSYPSTPDDRATLTDQSSTHNIWADGDVEQWFDNDSVALFGDPAEGAGKEMGFADTRIDDFFNLDVDTDAEVENAGRTTTPDDLIDDSFTEDATPYAEVDAAGSELSFTQDDPAIDIDSNIDDAGAGEATEYLEFDA